MASGGRAHSPEPTDRWKAVRDWIDVTAKALIALAGISLTYLASTYQQRTSVVTLLSQRETAESELRSSMMGHLIGPFVGTAEQSKPLDTDRALVLLELLALNFHTHFELKPLFLKVDGDLQHKGQTAGRAALQAVARRIVDRQIAMLQVANPEVSKNLLSRLFSRSPANAEQHTLFFARTNELQDPGVTLRAADEMGAPRFNDSLEKTINVPTNPAWFGDGGGQCVCSVSPDQKYAVRVRVTSYDPDQRTAVISWQVAQDPTACERAVAGDGTGALQNGSSTWQPARSFTLSPYDFPLTDNAQVDPNRRLAFNLYYIDDSDPQSLRLVLKLVWFPEGYITERERPMNYYEVNKTLGME